MWHGTEWHGTVSHPGRGYAYGTYTGTFGDLWGPKICIFDVIDLFLSLFFSRFLVTIDTTTPHIDTTTPLNIRWCRCANSSQTFFTVYSLFHRLFTFFTD